MREEAVVVELEIVSPHVSERTDKNDEKTPIQGNQSAHGDTHYEYNTGFFILQRLFRSAPRF
jgi:hypothetical protein